MEQRNIKRFQEPRNGIQYIASRPVREELSPLVFFDAGSMVREDEGMFFDMHPHSGIAIISLVEGGGVEHGDSLGNGRRIPSGGVQWIRAGKGIWHEERYVRPEGSDGPWPLAIHQLWLQLPPELEESEPDYLNLLPEEVPSKDGVRIIVGEYHGVQSALNVPFNMTYLDVALPEGKFSFKTPPGQTRGFIYARQGTLKAGQESIRDGHIALLEENEDEIVLEADVPSKFVLVLAEPANYPMVTGMGSIHTEAGALKRSQANIIATRP